MVATRQVIGQEIDWPCQIERLYSDENQGFRLGPMRAITWFFEQVEEGIILEDDCVPHPDFFPYCTTLLELYRHDTRVWCISANNFQNGQWRGDGSYYFSRYNHCWGWASWRRCWQHYDADLVQWLALRDSGRLNTIFEDPLERKYWGEIWQRTHAKTVPITWWDYQWTFTWLVNSGLITSLPNHNLVSNVGFGADATHTIEVANPTVADQGLGELKHPGFLLRNGVADHFTLLNIFGGMYLKANKSILRRLLRSGARVESSVSKIISSS